MTTEDATVNRPDWRDTVFQEQKRRDESLLYLAPRPLEVPDPGTLYVLDIPRKYLSDAEISITERPVETLIAQLATGDLRSLEVTQAFLQRARIAQKLVNCITELLSEQALARAKELDEYYATHKKPIGPLHGLPMSVKEHIGLKGLDANTGVVAFIGRKSPIDAVTVRILKQAGAIIFSRTTEPQGLMMLECTSNVHGTTSNPHNTDLTCGGSSGGEGALLALCGSPLGLGGDLGGSIRAPAVNCGLYGLRPTTGRLPLIGLFAHGRGCEAIMPTLGPMSRTFEGISIFMKTVLDSKPWENDPGLHQIPWRNERGWVERKIEAGEMLKIGVLWDDGWIKPLPPVERAIRELTDKLQHVPGVEVVNWEPHRYEHAIEIMTKLYSPDAGASFEQSLQASGEPWKPLAKWRLQDRPGIKALTMPELWHWTFERELYRHSFFQAWKASGIDLLVCPAGPSPAPQHNTSRYWGYLSLFNMLDYPALVFPVGRVDASKDSKPDGYEPRNDEDKVSWANYDVDKERNAPIGLQIVGRKLEDEKVVEGLRWLKEKLGLPFVDVFEGLK